MAGGPGSLTFALSQSLGRHCHYPPHRRESDRTSLRHGTLAVRANSGIAGFRIPALAVVKLNFEAIAKAAPTFDAVSRSVAGGAHQQVRTPSWRIFGEVPGRRLGYAFNNILRRVGAAKNKN